MNAPPQIWRLPAQIASASHSLRERGSVALVLRFSPGIRREKARVQLRQTITEFLVATYDLSESQISIDDRRGSAPEICLRSHDQLTRLAASFAYDGECAVCALTKSGRIGIDLVNGNSRFDWRETARLYLGAVESQRIEQCSREQQIYEFFRSWSGWEASLKCFGLPLQEWTIDLAQQLEQCQIAHAVLERSYMCAIATRPYAK